MTRAAALPVLAALLVAAAGLAAVLLPRLRREDRVAERVRAVGWQGARGSPGGGGGGRPSAAAGPASGGAALAAAMRRVGAAAVSAGVVGPDTLADLRRTVAAAGFRSNGALTAFLGAKVCLLLGLPLLVLAATPGFSGGARLVASAGAAIAGLLAPDMALRALRDRHRAAVARALPDALDLLVICAEAGLPLEAAVERVSRELAEASPAVAAEFATTATELRILPDRRTALMNMGARTGLEPLRRLGGTLAQTLQYGTPVTQALRVLAAELRHETLMRFEARAARLPVILTVPTVLFILPCIFLVVGGPAVLKVLDLFAGGGR